MHRALVPTLTLTVAILATSVGHAEWSVSNTGTWPKSWPVELEPLRSHSRTLQHSSYTMYHIPFADRAQFEAAWPHFLAIATHDTPFMLSSGPDTWTAVDFDAGVVVFTPNAGQLITFGDKHVAVYPTGAESWIPGGKFLRVGPPWPGEIKDESGKLPEYVVQDGQKWRPTTVQELRNDQRSGIRAQRARTEIRLIVDGKIVDLNRIQLPACLIDKRFVEKPIR